MSKFNYKFWMNGNKLEINSDLISFQKHTSRINVNYNYSLTFSTRGSKYTSEDQKNIDDIIKFIDDNYTKDSAARSTITIVYSYTDEDGKHEIKLSDSDFLVDFAKQESSDTLNQMVSEAFVCLSTNK